MSADHASVACGLEHASAAPSDVVPNAKEVALVERARRGDVAAYEVLIRRYEPLAYRLARTIARHPDDAEEATQDAFLKAYRALHRFREGAAFRPWLLTIVANEARNRSRARTRLDAVAARAFDGFEGTTASADAPYVALVRAEERRDLLAALDRLPDKLRDVLVCRHILDLSERDAASVLGIRTGTVKSRLSRALARLGHELAWIR